jgi:hypothetical protein
VLQKQHHTKCVVALNAQDMHKTPQPQLICILHSKMLPNASIDGSLGITPCHLQPISSKPKACTGATMTPSLTAICMGRIAHNKSKGLMTLHNSMPERRLHIVLADQRGMLPAAQ